MKKGWLVVLALLVIIIVGLVLLFAIPASTVNAPAPVASSTQATPSAGIPEVTANITNGEKVTSGEPITGFALGNWYFEGSFPVQLLDSKGAVIASVQAKAQEDWMQTGRVKFVTDNLTFATQPAGSHGTLVFKNDNPSGDPARQKELDIQVIF